MFSGGYRVTQLTPHLAYAEVTANSKTSDPGLTVSALPAFLAGPATRLGAGSPGTLSNLQPGFQPGGSVSLFSAVIDFVL